jgi:hypothetical protein
LSIRGRPLATLEACPISHGSGTRCLLSPGLPSLLVAALPLAAADVSRLAKRPRSGCLDTEDSAEIMDSEEGGQYQLEGSDSAAKACAHASHSCGGIVRSARGYLPLPMIGHAAGTWGTSHRAVLCALAASTLRGPRLARGSGWLSPWRRLGGEPVGRWARPC